MTHTKEDYKKYVEQKSPNSPWLRNPLWAFAAGGLICAAGQGLNNLYDKLLHLDRDTVNALVPISMIFLGVLLTGLNVYDSLAKYAGAGTIVPITGFANAITAPAMEFKKEGYVTGLAAKMFVIAGPVLVYGTVASILVGLVYYIGGNI